jgi:recombination protein RecA
LLFGKGISQTRELVEMALQAGLLKRNGSWYLYKDEKVGQGILNATTFLKNNSKMRKELKLGLSIS